MRIVVQNTRTELFFGCDNHWMEDREQALDFKKVSCATRFLKEKQCDELQIVICLNDADYDYWLGVDELG